MEEIITGIYKITNIKNNKCYIGSSKNIKRRWKEHIRELNKHTHHSSHFQRAWSVGKKENFKFEVLEITTEDKLFEREQYWLDYYKSYDNKYGYNICDKAGEPPFDIKTKLKKQKLKEETERKNKLKQIESELLSKATKYSKINIELDIKKHKVSKIVYNLIVKSYNLASLSLDIIDKITKEEDINNYTLNIYLHCYLGTKFIVLRGYKNGEYEFVTNYEMLENDMKENNITFKEVIEKHIKGESLRYHTLCNLK